MKPGRVKSWVRGRLVHPSIRGIHAREPELWTWWSQSTVRRGWF